MKKTEILTFVRCFTLGTSFNCLPIRVLFIFLFVTMFVFFNWILSPSIADAAPFSNENLPSIFNTTSQLKMINCLTFHSNENLLFSNLGIFKHVFSEVWFGKDPNLLSIVWAILWRIPWRAQFGKMFEWIPFFLSLFWLVVWHFIMLIIHYRRSLKNQNANSMFYEFTKFLQIIYVFCCTQAIL